ncbi:MAG: c-type cytochrome [Gemmatimonadota bacterium]
MTEARGRERFRVRGRKMRVALSLGAAIGVLPAPLQVGAQEARGRALYRAACENCHGPDGRGVDVAHLGFDDPGLPDFTDCRFASREPAADWESVVSLGGPVRSFSRRMPAFGKALAAEEISAVVEYVRSLCTDPGWPRGELNFPRPILTEKAFPEDEFVVAASFVPARASREATAALIYEKRFGARNQYEVTIPFGSRGTPGWQRPELGNISLGLKRALAHDGVAGRIVSGGAELILPTSSEGGGGKGFIFEPFVLGGMALGPDAFLQGSVGHELPFSRRRGNAETFVTAVLGRTWAVAGGSGRAFTPMIEVSGVREWERGGAANLWTAVPQMQFSLSRRQHILASVGLSVPLGDRSERRAGLVAYLLWDWFDGGFRDGWR